MATIFYASVRPSGPDRTPVAPQPSEPAAMSSRRGCHRACSNVQQTRNRRGLSGLVMLSDDEDADDEDSDASPSPPWRLEAAARWASLSHRLLVRQDIRNKHCFLKATLEHPNCSVCILHPNCSVPPWNITLPVGLQLPRYLAHSTVRWSACYTLNTYGRLLQTLRQHRDPLSARDIWSYIDGRLVNGHLVY